MYRLLTALLLSATPAFADDTTTSDLVADKGLAVARQQLEAKAASPDRDMALAAVRFLSGIETAYQERWRIGSTSPILPTPVMGTDLMSVNPAPEDMQPDFLNNLSAQIAESMRSAREVLPEKDAALVLNLHDLWFDINMDGERQPNENLLDLAMIPLPEGVEPTVRFDTADTEWLRAYTHLIEAACTLVIAFDTEPALARQINLIEALEQQHAESQPSAQKNEFDSYLKDQVVVPIVDMIAVIIPTLRNQPDKAKIQEAQDHLNRMIEANRVFWSKVAKESDDNNEWIPNDNQTAAMGFDIPKGAGATWLAVLDQAEMALNGEKLIPYWRFAPGYGIDLQKWIDDPQPVDLITWIHGSAALPYAAKGDAVDVEAWDNFINIFGSQRAGLYMILFN